MKFRYLREGILSKMGKVTKVAGGMAAAGGALQAGKMVHNAIKPKEVSEYDDYDCDEGLGRSVLKTVAKTKKFVKSASPNAKEFALNTLQGGALIGGGAAIGGHLSRKANESDYDCDESIGSSAAVAGAGLLGGCTLARLGGRSAEKKIKRPKSVSEYDDYDCDEGVIGKTVKYGLAAGAALGAGKMARDAIKNRKAVSEYDDYDCDEGIGGTILKTVARGKNLAKDYIGTAKGVLSKTASKTKNLAKDYVGTAKGALKNASKSTAAKVAAGTAAAGAAAGAVAGSKLAGKKNESLAAAINGGRIPRRARSFSVQESALSPSDKVQRAYCSMYPSDELGEELNPRVTFRDLYDGMRKGKDFYKMIGEGDSVIRERIFEMLSDIYGVKYNDIYNMWLALL